MIEVYGDLFAQDGWICITTNGIVKNDSRLVMGAGIAKVARDKWRGLDLIFGRYVKEFGNIPCPVDSFMVISFPTKNHFKDDSDINLIEKSALWIKEWVDKNNIEKLFLSRVGCGMGRLNWNDVKIVLDNIFTDDRFVVVS